MNHEYIAVGIAAGVPFLTILLGFFFNNKQFESLRSELGDIKNRLGVMEHDLREFYRLLGILEGRMDERGK